MDRFDDGNNARMQNGTLLMKVRGRYDLDDV